MSDGDEEPGADMIIRQTHDSPDGQLRLQVVEADDGDVAIGFAGFAWHTHADILAAPGGLPEDTAVAACIRSVLGNQAVIVVLRVGDAVRDGWVTEDPAGESRYLENGEALELRYWDGSLWNP
jgi:hypothetical protein